MVSKCFLCQTALEPVNDAEIEGVDVCIDCCSGLDAIVADYLTSSPGGLELILDIIKEELSNPDSRLREPIKEIVKEVISQKS